MLPALKDDDTTVSFLLCHLFYMPSMIYAYINICTKVHLYIIMVCTDSATMAYVNVLLATVSTGVIGCLVSLVCAYVGIV